MAEPDYDALLQASLFRVFSERDVAKREAAIAELYTADPVMFEPDKVITGRAEISALVDALLAQFGPDFAFAVEKPGEGHHGLGMLHWQAGPKGAPPVVHGIDIAEVVDGRIARLWVLLHPAG